MEQFDSIAQAAWDKTHQPTQYLSCAETAKLVRGALKAAFPGVKFSVKSSVYSGGASISVKWVDGPRQRDVERVAGQYAGGRFDGMIDMAYNVSHYMRPDGSVMLEHNPGTAGSRGSDPGRDNRDLALVMPADVVRVQFGADYVFSEREISNPLEKIEQAQAWLEAHCHIEGGRFGNEWVDNIARSMAHDYLTGEDWAETFERRHKID